MHGEILETMTRQKYRNFLISHGQLSEVEETKIQQKPSSSGWATRDAQEPAHTTGQWNLPFRVPFLKTGTAGRKPQREKPGSSAPASYPHTTVQQST